MTTRSLRGDTRNSASAGSRRNSDLGWSLPTAAPRSLSRAVRRALYGAGVRGAAVALLAAGVAGLAAADPGNRTESFPAAFELSSLLPVNGGDGTNGFVL